MAEIIGAGHLDHLPPAALAGTLCALVYDSNRTNIYSRLSFSNECHETIKAIYKTMRRVKKLQEKHGVDTVLRLDPTVASIIEAWAQGADWEFITGNTSLEEGDLVRLIRRTTDVVRQIVYLPGMSPTLVSHAREAVQGLMRDPVKEVEFLVPGDQHSSDRPLP